MNITVSLNKLIVLVKSSFSYVEINGVFKMKIELQISPTEEDVFKITFNMENGVITTTDNEGLINQEKVDKSKLPIYIKQTFDKVISDLEKKQ